MSPRNTPTGSPLEFQEAEGGSGVWLDSATFVPDPHNRTLNSGKGRNLVSPPIVVFKTSWQGVVIELLLRYPLPDDKAAEGIESDH